MRTVRAGAVAGLAAQVGLLAALADTVRLPWPAWVAGLGCGVVANGWLATALDRAARPAMGPADVVTLARATLVGGVAALTVGAFVGAPHIAVLIALCVLALVLDGVDGRVARVTGTESALGARFDMEVDAFLILTLSCYDARQFGAWVLLIGGARYLFGGAGRVAGWLRAPLPPRYWRKVVAAVVGIVLAVAAGGVLPQGVAEAALVGALLLLAESFGRDVVLLARQRDRVRAVRGARVLELQLQR